MPNPWLGCFQPFAAKFDAESRFPWENVRKMADLGYFGVNVPEEYGGRGLDYVSYILVLEELARVDASHSITVSAHSTLGMSPILAFGTEEQKQRYLPLLASGRVLGGFGLTEPAAGSDAAATQTVAVREGDSYRINGSKIFRFIADLRTSPRSPISAPGGRCSSPGARMSRAHESRA